MKNKPFAPRGARAARARQRFASRLPLFAAIGIAVAAALPAGCGFQLRGSATLPFASMYVQAPPASLFAAQLKRAVSAGSQTRITEDPKDAQVILQILNETREKQILSLSGAGRVSEYRLRYRVSYRLLDDRNVERMPADQIVLQRDLTFTDAAVISKESEEALLYRDMQNDAVQQLVRRLQFARLDARP